MTPEEPQELALPEACATSALGAASFLALANALATVLLVPSPVGSRGLTTATVIVGALETLGLGTLGAACVWAFVRFVPAPRWAMLLLAGVAGVGVVYVSVGAYLELSAIHARDGQFATVALVNSLGLAGSALAAAPVVGARLAAHPKLRVVPIVLAVALLAVDHAVLRDDYAGIHCLVAVSGALLVGPSVAPFVARALRRLGRTGSGLFALVTLASLVVSPPNALRHELFRQPCAIAPWVLATFVWSPPSLHSAVVHLEPAHATDTSPAPPTASSPLPKDLLVVLVTIDALRADVVLPPANLARFPTLAALVHDGAVFTHASTPGTQTSVSLAATFSGRMYSEQRWEDYGKGKERYPYPATDDAPRFPELLSAHGVTTVLEASFVFLVNRFGVTRGFGEETSFGKPDGAAPAATLVKAAEARLARLPDAPAFLYMHFGEPHAPYHTGTGDDFHRYLAAVAVADAQLGRILRTLQDHFGDRWALVVSADHGEAFGEHQSYEHAKTLYEELLHVPLIVRSPLLAPRRVDERVGLIDLGPTILDMFGVETPPSFHGQTLLPLLLGRPTPWTRPLLAEARLERELTQEDGTKVIEDSRRKTVEVYDLVNDPKETRNLWNADPARSDRALAQLRAFYDEHTLRARGYEPPYKP